MRELIELMPALAEAGGADNKEMLVEALCFAAWRRAVGAKLNLRVRPLSFQDGALRVAVSGLTARQWIKELEAGCPKILAKANRLLGRELIRSVSFVMEPAAAQPEARSRAAARAARVKGNEMIPDRALREAFRRAAAKFFDARPDSVGTDLKSDSGGTDEV